MKAKIVVILLLQCWHDYIYCCHTSNEEIIMIHNVHNMKREDQQDAAIRCLLLTSVSTCCGHHYAHLRENKGPVTAFGVLFWFCWMWLVVVVGHCVVGCEHNAVPHNCYQPHPAEPEQHTK